MKYNVTKSSDKELLTWMDAIEQLCSLQISHSELVGITNEAETNKLQQPPPGWTLEADEELARFLVEQSSNNTSDVTAQGNEYLTRIEASSGEVSQANCLNFLII